MKTRPPCLDWREKLALRYEDLSLADQQALDAHIQTCNACATALADYHFFEARLDALPPPAIKPLPRLSPHFFAHTSEESSATDPRTASNAPASVRLPRRRQRRPGRTTRVLRHLLSIAAVLVLLLGTVAVFHAISSARLASQPGGNTLFNLNQHNSIVDAVAWSPDGQYIATASVDHTVKVWSASKGYLICTYSGDDEIYALAWSPNSKLLASGGGDNMVHIWNAADCSSNNAYATHTESGPVVSLAWSPDGQYIASGGWDYMAQIWNVSNGKQLHSLSFSEVVSSIAWSHNGRQIAVGSWDKSVSIWDTSTGQVVNTYSYYSDAINAVAWSPNDRYLAIGDNNGTVEVRDMTRGTVVCEYTGHTNAVNTVAWSPDGKYLASGGNDRTVRVWNPFSPATPTLMIYTQHKDNISSVAWSLNGKEIVSGSWDSTAKVWVVM
jgi:WD40 repeat protein